MRAGRAAASAALLFCTAAAAGSPGGGRDAGRARATAVSPAALLGRWGDNGDCSRDVIFRGDGTFRSFNGGEGRWRLAGDRLTMAGPGGSFTMRVARLGRDRLRIVNADGSVGVSQRC